MSHVFGLIMLGALVATSVPDESTSSRIVVVASIVSIHVRGEADFERDRATYVHTNLQPVLLHVERSLAGDSVPKAIIVGLDVTRSDHHLLHWFTGSWGGFDGSEWVVGRLLIAALRPNARVNGCGPPRLYTSLLDSNSDIDPNAEWEYTDPSLTGFKDAPVYCGSVDDVYFIHQKR